MNLTFQFKRKIEILTTLLFLFLYQLTWSQNAGQYVFSQSSGTYTALSSPTSLGSGSTLDNNIYSIASGSLSGFTFNFAGTNYTAFTVSANGFIGFGSSTPSGTLYTPLSSTGGGNVFVSAISADLGGVDANTVISWKLEGTAPNRTLVFEWKNFKNYYQASAFNFQIRLQETTNLISIVYGSMTYTSTTSTTYQVGIKSSTTTGHYSNRTTTTNWNATTAGGTNAATCTLVNTATMPTSGLTFTWTAPTCSSLPTALAASNITTSSATTSWTAPSPAPAMGYDYELRTSGTAGSGATGLISSGTTAAGVTTQAFSSLTTNTSYSLYVRSKCDASTTSAWTSALAFSTAKIEPTNQMTNLAAGTVTTTAIPLAWTAAAAGSQLPDGYLIRSSTVDLASIPDPVDGTDLTDVTTYTSGAANKKQTTGTATSTTTFSGMTAGTMYYYKTYSYTNTGTAINYNTTSVPTLSYATLPSVVTTLAFSTTTDTGSTLSWALPAGYDATKHQVLVFLKSGSSITTGTPTSLPSTYTASSVFGSGSAYQNDANAKAVYSGDGTTVTVSGLSSTTSYYALVYVIMESANSNGTASYSAATTANVTTTCATATLPVTQGFNTTTIPSCWTQQYVTGATALTFPVSAINPVILPQEGLDFVMWNSYNATSGNQTRLVSQPINSNGLIGAGLRFYWFHDNSAYTTSQYIGEGVKIQYSTNGTTWTDVQAIDRLLTGTNGWTLYDINLPAAVVNQSNLYIGFLFTSKLGDNCALDNVTIYASTGCVSPSNLSSSSITSNSANITFTAPTSVPTNGYDVYYSTSNVAPASNATPSVDNSTSTTVALTGLNANTLYYWWVRSDCNTDVSSWLSGGSFTTFKIEPTNQVTNLAAGTVTTTAIPLAWTAAVAGSQLPDGYLIRSSNVDLASIPDPVDGTDLTDVTTFTSGAANKKQTTGTATSTTTFSGMTAGTMYHYKAFSYTNTGTAINYNTTSAPTLSYATLPSSTTALAFSATTTSGSTLSWSLPAGYDATKHQVLVFLKSGSSITAGTPTSLPSTYTASSVFGSGSAYQNDASANAVYSGDGTTVSISGLSIATTYYALVYVVMETANSNGNASYSAATTANVTSAKSEPTNQLTNLAASTVTTTAIPLAWTAAVAGSQLPDGYLIRSSNVDLASIPDPVDGTDLTDVTTYTSGAANKKQTTGTATSTTTFSGMTAGTMYYYKAYSYTNTGTAINYNTTSAPTLSYATLPSSTTALAFSATTTSGSTLSWSLPAGYDATKHQVVVFLKSGSTITSGTPTSLASTYTASTVFGSGSAYQNDSSAKAIYNGDGTTVTVSGLSSSTVYYALVYVIMESANSNGTASYSAPTNANITTPCSAVTTYPASEGFASYLPTCWTEGDGGDLTTGPVSVVTVNDATSLWTPDDYLNSGTTTLGSAKINIYSNVQNDWLISPSYTLSSVYRLKYGVGATEWDAITAPVNAWESDDYVQLLVNEIGTSTWTVLKTYNSTNVPSNLGQIETFDLSSYLNKTVRFAFRSVEGTSNGSADIDFFIDNFTIEVPPADIVVTPSGSTTICSGTSVNLVASSTEGYTYTWSPSTGLSATTGSSVTASPTATTTYTVSGVSGSMNNTKTITVTVNPNADTITVPSSYSVCSDSPIALVSSLPPTNLVLGSGTTAGTSSNTPYRFNISTANSSRVQYLITKAELNAIGFNTAGYIRSLGFNVVTLAGTTASSYEIKMANVTNTSLSTTYLTPTFTTVFSNSVTIALGLNTHTFSTPFYWDGTSNIVINICHNSPATGNTIVAVTTPAQTSTISGSGATQCTTATGATNASRPVMTFGVDYLSTVSWSPSTDLYLDNAATQPYAGESRTTVYYKGATTRNYTVTNTLGSCSKQATTTVNVIAPPTAKIAENVTICIGSSTNILFTGTPNATVTYSNGTSTSTVTLNNAGSASVTVSPTTTTTYSLVSVSTASTPVCTSSLSESITVTVQALPSASVTAATGVICSGSSAIFNISGTTDSVVSYTINGGSVATTTLVDGASQITINDVSTAQVINLVSVSTAICTKNLTAQASVELGTVGTLATISDIYVDATTKKYSVVSIANAQTYEWTLPSSIGLISSNTLGNEILVSIPSNYVAGDGILSVKAIGTCGTSNTVTRTITPITPTITGLSVICPDTTTSVTYQAPIISGASYNWVLPVGMSLTSGAGTSSITVAVSSSFLSGYVSLTISTSERTYTNRLIVGRVGSPAVINGPVSLCSTTTATYSVDPIADAQSYVWEVPSGISIVSGSGTNSISVSVTPSFVTGTIKVYAVGSCGAGLARSLVVSKTPGAINLNGPKSICGQSTTSYSITSGAISTTLNSVFIYATSALNGVSNFLWTVPTGATIVQGQGTSMIYVTYSTDFISGPITVVPQVSCGTASVKSITVNNSVVAVSGPSDLCGLTEATYSVPSTAGTNFVWTVPAGMQIVTGAGTSTIKVSISATCASSTISVAYQSSCSNNGLTATKTVGCAIQSALYPTFCGTTLTSMGSTLIANEIVGATKYKFTVQNGATTYSFESTTRFFKLTDLNVALLYATPYTINVSVLINGIWYNSACNGCVVTTPSVGVTKLISSQCNSNLASFTSSISADIVSNATEYMFEVVGPGVSVTYSSNVRWFRLSQITSVQFAYGTVYSIRVKAKIGDQWSAYGDTCTVTTPSVPSTSVATTQCGTTLSSMSTAVVANIISGATSYKFEIVGSNLTTEYTTNVRWFKFSDITGVTILYGTPYTIRVKVLVNGQWGEYSSSCIITTPSIPTTTVITSQCGGTLTKLYGSISANIVPSVTQYMFEVTSGASVFEYSTANRWFRLTDVVGLSVLNNTTYGVRVRVMLNGQWGSYGESCNVSTPVATTTTKDEIVNEEVKVDQKSSITLYPNPFVEHFSIALEGYNSNEVIAVTLFDITGKQIFSNRMLVSEIQDIQLGKDLTSGIYLLKLESDSINKTYKLVKK